MVLVDSGALDGSSLNYTEHFELDVVAVNTAPSCDFQPIIVNEDAGLQILPAAERCTTARASPNPNRHTSKFMHSQIAFGIHSQIATSDCPFSSHHVCLVPDKGTPSGIHVGRVWRRRRLATSDAHHHGHTSGQGRC